MNAVVYDLTYSKPIVFPVKMFVNSYSRSVKGGCKEASISLRGSFTSMQEVFRLMRSPIEIYDFRGELTWWGYIYSVEVRWGSRTITVSMGSMKNKVLTYYTKKTGGKNEKLETAWAQDDYSVSRYGIKQGRIDGRETSAADAVAKRDMALLNFKYPRRSIETGMSEGGSDSALMRCNGWYSTSYWQFYTNAGTADVDNGTQISTIASSMQFISGVSGITTGITSKETRDGARQMGSYIEELQATGTSNNRLIVTEVDRYMVFRVREASAESSVGIYVDEKDVWRTPKGVIVPRSTCPVGLWIQNTGLPISSNMVGLFDPNSTFINSCTYDVVNDKLQIEPLGSNSPFAMDNV